MLLPKVGKEMPNLPLVAVLIHSFQLHHSIRVSIQHQTWSSMNLHENGKVLSTNLAYQKVFIHFARSQQSLCKNSQLWYLFRHKLLSHHVLLAIACVIYILAGAWVFRLLEAEHFYGAKRNTLPFECVFLSIQRRRHGTSN